MVPEYGKRKVSSPPNRRGGINCPFYGFNFVNNELRESTGYQCGLRPGTLCYFGRKNALAKWKGCRYETPETMEKLKKRRNSITVIFRDLSLESISLREWMNMFQACWRK